MAVIWRVSKLQANPARDFARIHFEAAGFRDFLSEVTEASPRSVPIQQVAGAETRLNVTQILLETFAQPMLYQLIKAH